MYKIFFTLFSLFFLASCSLTGEKNTTPTESRDDTMMREHCQMMPEMAGCEKYITHPPKASSDWKTLNNRVLTEDATVTDAKPTEVVTLKDGQTYDLIIQKVRKNINGKTLIMLSYNGSIPWSTFRVPKGATIKFKVRNTVSELATTIHPHGVRLNYLYDGVPREHGGAQDPIKVDDVYEQIITFPDTGTFWYHPHTRDDFEQELGEYGTFLVYDPNEKPAFDSESIITLDDILLKPDGTVADFSTDTVDHTLMGRYGNTMLVNGETDFSLTMNQWEVKRLSLVNVANARPFDFAIPGVRMKLVSGDNGYYQKEMWVDHIVIGPAERYTVDIMSEKSGNFWLESIGGGKIIPLGTLTVTPSAVTSIYKKDFETLGTHDILENLKLDDFYKKSPEKSLTIGMTMGGMMGMENMQMGGMMGMNHEEKSSASSVGTSFTKEVGVEWEDTMNSMNTNSTDKNLTWNLTDDTTGKKNMDIRWDFKKGSLVKIHINNPSDQMHPMPHPFHMHGQRFLILMQNGVKNSHLVWKDTVLIPKWQSVDILVDMSNPGIWMAHCHILEHLFAGMMFDYTVSE